MEIKKLILVVLFGSLVLLVYQCNLGYAKKNIWGDWDIQFAHENNVSMKYEFTLNVLMLDEKPYKVNKVISYGLLPTRFEDKCNDPNLYHTFFWKKGQKQYVKFLVSDCNSFFRDTFEVLQLDTKFFWIKSKTKEMKCARMYNGS